MRLTPRRIAEIPLEQNPVRWPCGRRWRETALVGLTGMLGSLGWFCAFALQNAAYVRALGQIELLFGIAVAAIVFRERVSVREFAGILTLGVSLIMIILAL